MKVIQRRLKRTAAENLGQGNAETAGFMKEAANSGGLLASRPGPPPSCVVQPSRRESATPQPVLSVPSWKTPARVLRKPQAPFAPSLGSGRVVLLPIECASSFYATHRSTPALNLTKCGNLEKARDGKITG